MVKNLPVNAGDLNSVPGWGRSPGEGNGNPLQYSCLENSKDRGAWWTSPWGRKESDTTERPTKGREPHFTRHVAPNISKV